MKTILEVIGLATRYLQQHDVSSARYSAEEIVSIALKRPRLDLYLAHEEPLTEQELTRCRELLARRGRGEPVQYIEGSVSFFNCQIEVGEEVLIPRPETEQLVERIAKDLSDCRGKILWDVCCGSGCIGIALKKAHPELHVVLSDLSKEALSVAARNAEQNEVEVTLLHGDLLDPFSGNADIIVSNPPYVSEEEYEKIQREVKEFEPKVALVSGPTGLEVYKRLAEQCGARLHRGGHLYLEIGYSQAIAVQELFEKGPWEQKECQRDWSGRDRFFSLVKQSPLA